MRIFPEKYEELDIDKFDKQLMATVKKLYRDNEIATFMLSCNPSKTQDGIVDILITDSGVLCIKVLGNIKQEDLMPRLFERQVQQKQELQIICDRMKLQKMLISGNELKYSVRIVSVFPLCKKPDLIDNSAMKEFNTFVENDCYFDDFFSKAMREKSFIDRMLIYKNKNQITETVLPDIVNRLTPEYTIPQRKAAISNVKKDNTPKKLIDQDVTIDDRAV